MTVPVPLKLGVIGCGRVFETFHYPALRRTRDWKLTAVCDPLAHRRGLAVDSRPDIRGYSSWKAMLELETLDGVLITTPPASHCQLAMAALEAGCHVLVEKPMALDTGEGAMLLRAADRAGKKLWICHNRRFKKPYLALKARLSGLPPQRVRRIFFTLEIDARGWGSVTGFLGDEDRGGGVLDDVVSHQIDLLGWLLGRAPTAVRARLQQTERGSQAQVELRYGSGLVATCLAAHGDRYREELVVETGARAWYVFPSGLLPCGADPAYPQVGARMLDFLHYGLCRIGGLPNATVRSFQELLSHFARAVRDDPGAGAGATGRDGLQTMEIIAACRAGNGAGWRLLEGQARTG